ncbi:MAG: electron transport complex subunit RsxB [Rubrivivax sp.]
MPAAAATLLLAPPAAAPSAAAGADPAEPIDALLPQTQCRRCGFADCRGYAEAIAAGSAEIDRCPPGGAEGIARLARLTGRALRPLDPQCGREEARALAVIDESGCIGCTLCIEACPVDCIVGARKAMHTVIDAQCTGCALCLPACPVDCIAMQPASGSRTGWAAWSAGQAAAARARHLARRQRRARSARADAERPAPEAGLARAADDAAAAVAAADAAADPAAAARKRAAIEAALARARERVSAP